MKNMEEKNWETIIKPETRKRYFEKLEFFLKEEYREETIYPKKEDLWNAFKWTSYKNVKVVILGQDPYHGKGQAHGLSFSVEKNIKIPPSLRNIYKELANDLNIPIANHGYLKKWAEQGVFLLNTVLTVRAGQAGSHRGKGWEKLTNHIISSLNQKENTVIFVLWGAEAKKKRKLIDEKKHYVLTSFHPSPLSAYRGFFGSSPFSKTNKLLIESGQKEIDWEIS